METHPLKNLSIRDGVVRQAKIGYILACDPELEEQEILHTNFFKWNSKTFIAGNLDFSAHTICIISVPEFAIVMLAGFGEYGVTTADKNLAGNVFENQTKREEYGAFRVVAEIAGKAYAAGLRGMVYRLDGLTNWVQIDNGLPSSFDITAIDGFGSHDIYAVGYNGEVWRYDGSSWVQLDLPTNANLTCVRCSVEGIVYIGGYNGLLVKGNADTWEVIARDETTETIWDIEWFNGEIYVSTMSFVYQLVGDEKLILPEMGGNQPETCYHLSMVDNTMWSIGAKDIVSFDGKTWTKIV